MKRRPWKVIATSTATIFAAFLHPGSSKALTIQTEVIQPKAGPGLTIEERLTRVREQLQQSSQRLSHPTLAAEETQDNAEMLLAQWGNWGNYWNNWSNNWNNWSNYWSNWGNW